MTTSEILMVCLTAVIATAGVIGAVIFNNQLTVMQGQLDEMKSVGESTKRSADAAKEAADATRDSVNLAKDTAERQLRAYVGIESADLIFQANIIYAAFELKNSGQTPAYDLISRLKMGTWETKNGSLLPPPFDKEVANASKLMIGPGGRMNPRVDLQIPPPLLPAVIAGMQKGEVIVYVIGRIEYRDAFNHQRFVNLRLISVKNISGTGWQLQPAEEGNDAN